MANVVIIVVISFVVTFLKVTTTECWEKCRDMSKKTPKTCMSRQNVDNLNMIGNIVGNMVGNMVDITVAS